MTTVILSPADSTTAINLLEGAMSILRVLSPDTVLTDGEKADGLAALNEMLDSWSLSPLNLYKETSEDVVTVAKSGNAPHTWGLGGNWNTARPVGVDAVTFKISTTLDKPIKLIGWDDYAAIRIKSLNVNYPQYAYISLGYPLAQVYLYPVPSAGLTLTLWSRKPLATFNALTDPVSLPPGTVRAIKFNLAVTMAPMFQQSVDATTLKIAQTSLQQLQRANLRIPTIQADPALIGRGLGRYDIYSDGPR